MAHIHILGICGTFMGGIAALAKSMGHRVTGSDRNIYPPMSTQLEKLGIAVFADDDVSQLEPAPDLVIIGNALSRGHILVEHVLQRRLPYTSGPQWLGEQVLRQKHVLAIAGTHGKTTTASMLVWILEQAGLDPSFLVGGVVQPYGETARLTTSPYFVIEADEYDTAFFDKRSKFLHYFANTLVINNLEFDHADIFSDLAAIQQQFAYVIRTVPSDGQVIYPQQPSVQEVLTRGCWSQRIATGTTEGWQVQLLNAAGSAFQVLHHNQVVAQVNWQLIGKHNAENALMAIIAAAQVGIEPEQAAAALQQFTAPARRLEFKGAYGNVRVYDDFAHHPTAIATTIQAMRAQIGPNDRLIAIFEPRSNTMKAGVHKNTLAPAFAGADMVYGLQAEQQGSWQLNQALAAAGMPVHVTQTVPELVAEVQKHYQDRQATAADAHTINADAQNIQGENSKATVQEHWVVMSNGAFGGIHPLLATALEGVANYENSR